MVRAFFINWQDPSDRSWHPVAKLVRDDDLYFFCYTKGARRSPRFLPFGNMGDLNSIYIAPQLFPIFANRVMSEKRPEFHQYAEWSGLTPPHAHDPLLLMATMGGTRATDSLQVYPVPERNADGLYRTRFFSHGLRHLPEASQRRANQLSGGERLLAMRDVQNTHDEHAIALRTDDPAVLVGYCPRYLARDVETLSQAKGANLHVAVKRVNREAPAQYRLLCEITALWPRDFEPCGDEDHKPIPFFDISDLRKHVKHLRPPIERGSAL